jgi:hypothetical protein
MAKFKPVGSKKKKTDSKRGLLPCGIVIAIGFGLIFWLLYLVMHSGS